ncbi:MAG: Aspartyl-tRNA(Asn) amidotransferase subunit A @ Glutamyl-tRNA(Gln) amidotransferase subunit A, partial [uncultured Nocardioidaceae bacterium]
GRPPRPDGGGAGGGARCRGDLLGRGDPGLPRPRRGARPGAARLPPRRRRRRPRRGPGRRRPPSAGRSGARSCRGPGRGQGPVLHHGAADHLRLPDPAGVGPAVRRDRRHQASRGRHAGAGEDQPRRVRDGVEHRALGVRPDPQPLGHRAHPGRLRRRLGRRRRRAARALGDRHRHRRLDPAAGGAHGDRGRQADVRRGVALRHRRDGQQPRPGRPGDPDGPRRRPAPRGDRRPRPARLHEHRRPGASRRGGRAPCRRPGPARRCGDRARRRGVPARGPGPLRGGRRAARRGRRGGRGGLLPQLHPGAGDLLPGHAVGGLLEPGALRRDALRVAGHAGGRGRPERRAGDGRDPRHRVRGRGEAADHPRHLRAVQRLLRRVLRLRAEGARAGGARLRGRLRAGRRAGVADRAHDGVPDGGEARRPPRDVPAGRRDDPGQPRRGPRPVAAGRPGRGRAAGRRAAARPAHGRRPALQRRRRPRGAAARPVGRAAGAAVRSPGAGRSAV